MCEKKVSNLLTSSISVIVCVNEEIEFHSCNL
jgi:hypothetical protein